MMKTIKKHIIEKVLLLLFLMSTTVMVADPSDPYEDLDPEPELTLDNWVYALLICGLAYGAYQYQFKQKEAK